MYTTVSGVIVHKGYNNFISYSQVCTLLCVLCILICPHVYRTLTGSGRLQGRAFPYEKKKFIRKNKTTTKHNMPLHCFIKNEDDTYIGGIYTNLCNLHILSYFLFYDVLWIPCVLFLVNKAHGKVSHKVYLKAVSYATWCTTYGINMVLRSYFTGIVVYTSLTIHM